jgi:hypothetical protein
MDTLQSEQSEHLSLVTQPGQEWFEVIRRQTVEAFSAAFGSHPSMDGSVLAKTVSGAADIRRV